MSSILKIVFKGALATGMSGFPVGIASFIKNYNFQSRGEIMQTMKAIQTSEQLVSEKQSQRNQIEMKVKDLNIKVAAITQNAEKNTRDASKTLRKMMNIGMQSCKDKDKKGLIEAKEKIQIDGTKKEITYCYYPECDENLFLKKESKMHEWGENNTYVNNGDNHQIQFPFKKACFSISVNSENTTIKMALKDEINKTNSTKRGMLFTTFFDSAVIKHTAKLLSQDSRGKIWNIVKGKKLESTLNIVDQQIYKNLTNSINNGQYKSLHILETESKKQNVNFDLDKAFDMWKKFMDDVQNVNDLKNLQKKVLENYQNTLEKKTDAWLEIKAENN